MGADNYALGHLLACRMMLFADDGLPLFPLSSYKMAIPALLAFLAAPGFELKWLKIRGGCKL